MEITEISTFTVTTDLGWPLVTRIKCCIHCVVQYNKLPGPHTHNWDTDIPNSHKYILRSFYHDLIKWA